MYYYYYFYFLNISKRSNKGRILLAVLSVIWWVTKLPSHSQVILDQLLNPTNPQFPHLYHDKFGSIGLEGLTTIISEIAKRFVEAVSSIPQLT